ncbi:MAG: endonuclease III domain-containing protein [Planctomycetota bacterium]
MNLNSRLQDLYDGLREEFGHRDWWPGETPFEVMVGAILTQNTNWDNVEKAIDNLQERGALSPAAILNLEQDDLQDLVRPAGYYRQKAARVKRLAQWLMDNCDGAVELLQDWPEDELRKELVSIRGVGPETADSIMLYALDRPVFVVDTYTLRVTTRHGLIERNCTYYDLQNLFQDHLPEDLDLYRDFHAQLVEVGKRYCRPTPKCRNCPVRPVLGEPDLEEESF